MNFLDQSSHRKWKWKIEPSPVTLIHQKSRITEISVMKQSKYDTRWNFHTIHYPIPSVCSFGPWPKNDQNFIFAFQ